MLCVRGLAAGGDASYAGRAGNMTKHPHALYKLWKDSPEALCFTADLECLAAPEVFKKESEYLIYLLFPNRFEMLGSARGL